MDVLEVVLGVSELIDNISCFPDFLNVNEFPWAFKDSSQFYLVAIYWSQIRFYVAQIKVLQSASN